MKVTVRNLQKKIPLCPERIKRAVLKILLRERIKNAGAITICFVNDKEIKKMNLRYLGEDGPTDVMAFRLSGNKKEITADIVISTDTVLRNARVFKTTPLYELYLYITHGVLHILGYNDTTAGEKKIMHEKERFLLGKLNLKLTNKNAHP